MASSSLPLGTGRQKTSWGSFGNEVVPAGVGLPMAEHGKHVGGAINPTVFCVQTKDTGTNSVGYTKIDGDDS